MSARNLSRCGLYSSKTQFCGNAARAIVVGDGREEECEWTMGDEDLREAVRILAREHNNVFAPEMITALAATFIGVCALAVSVFEVRVLHSQERASFWPYMLIGEASSGDSPFVAVALMNQGTGPALRTAASVRYDGKYVKTWRELAEAAGMPDASITLDGILSTSALPAGERQAVFQVPNTEEYRPLDRAISTLHIKSCFCSLLDECWIVEKHGADAPNVTQRDLVPRKGGCDIPEEQQFLE